ncbi:MAG: hypothetical protein GKR90_03520 [Pseudomonadales bacterium]|nr:hypothetical protein [Pseudomonadales bacterium]
MTLIFFLVLGFIWSSVASAAPDLRIVIEMTERVQAADELELRSHLVREVVNFLPLDGTGSVWGYSGTTQRMVNHGKTDRMWRQVADIHGRHLAARGRRADPESALGLALWDFEKVDRGPIDVIWVSSGHIELANGQDGGQSRDRLLAEFAVKLQSKRVRLHAMAVGATAPEDFGLMRQLAEASGGLFREVTSVSGARSFAEDVLRLVGAHAEALVDSKGRFQIGPGTERFTVMWEAGAKGSGLRSPSGETFSRMKPLATGRWLLAHDYEMATIENPEPGWWEATGETHKVGVWSELEFLVEGLVSPVVPTDETSASLRLFSEGEELRSAAFLDLLDVRAWLVKGGDKQALPVDRDGSSYEIYCVHLEDGPHELEIGVIGPTFAQSTVKPFVVRNPLRADIRTGTDSAAAWVSFSHPDIDYRTIKASAKVRKPPQLGVIVPGQKMPGGIWQVPIRVADGILEITFSISGNYLNGEGFFLKTKPTALTLPLSEGQVETFLFDANGKRLSEQREAPIAPEPIAHFVASSPEDLSIGALGASEISAQNQREQVEPTTVVSKAISLPVWFVGVISLINLLLVAGIWWFLKPSGLVLEPLVQSDSEEPQPA